MMEFIINWMSTSNKNVANSTKSQVAHFNQTNKLHNDTRKRRKHRREGTQLEFSTSRAISKEFNKIKQLKMQNQPNPSSNFPQSRPISKEFEQYQAVENEKSAKPQFESSTKQTNLQRIE